MQKYQMIIQFVPSTKEETIDEYIEKLKGITEVSRIDKWRNKKANIPTTSQKQGVVLLKQPNMLQRRARQRKRTKNKGNIRHTRNNKTDHNKEINMTEKEIKQAQAEYKRFLMTALNVLRLNSKITDKEYTKIRDRILGNKEVTN